MRWHPARRRAFAYPLAALLSAALCVALAAPAGAEQVRHHKRHAKHHRVKPRPMYWGAWIGRQLTGTAAPWDMGAVSRFESLVGKAPALIQFASPFEDCTRSPCDFFPFPTEAMQSIRAYGAIPFFSWASEVSPRSEDPQPDFQLRDLIEGRYDSYIREFAAEARAWGHPFFLRFDWEMNGDWFPWGEGFNGNRPGEYIAAWRHVHDVFVGAGGTNATWVWCPYADEPGRYPHIKTFYPGNAYVDWVCMDGYNWGENAINPHRWKNFRVLFEKTYRKLKRIAPRKPIVIGETGSTPNGGHKAVWIRNMFRVLPRRFPRVRAWIYFNVVDRGVDWPLESSSTALSAFAKGIRRRIYVNNRFGNLAESPIRPPR